MTSKFLPPSVPSIPAAQMNYGGVNNPVGGIIVLHSMVYPCRPGAAKAVGEFFATPHPSNPTSAHYGVDPAATFQYVPDHRVAYHCGHNQDSIGVEMADMSTNDVTRWDDAAHIAMEANAVKLVAELCLAYDIRPWFVGWLQLKAGRKGITTHAQMTKAFHQSTHTDPGAWRRLRFMRALRAEIKAMRKAVAA